MLLAPVFSEAPCSYIVWDMALKYLYQNPASLKYIPYRYMDAPTGLNWVQEPTVLRGMPENNGIMNPKGPYIGTLGPKYILFAYMDP